MTSAEGETVPFVTKIYPAKAKVRFAVHIARKVYYVFTNYVIRLVSSTSTSTLKILNSLNS